MVKELKLTKTNLMKLIDWSSSSNNRLKKADVVNSMMQHVEDHEVGIFVYNPDKPNVITREITLSDLVKHNTDNLDADDKYCWTLMIDESNASIYRSSFNDKSEITEYRLMNYSEYYLIDNIAVINSRLADTIVDSETAWAADIDNAYISSKNDKIFLFVENDDRLEIVGLKDGKIYIDESFNYLSPEEARELFSFIQFNLRELNFGQGIILNYLHDGYLERSFTKVTNTYNLIKSKIDDESPENRAIIFDYIADGMTNGQVYQILEGVRDGLDVSVYADASYDYKQMHQIRMGMLNQLPYSLYSDATIDADKMRVIREALQSGVPVGVIADIIEKKEYNTMSAIELDAAMDNALDYNIDDLEYYIYDRYNRSNTITGAGFFLQRYEDAITKWHDLGNVNKSLAIYNSDIHSKDNNPVIIMDNLNGKERLILTQAYKEALGIDGLNESPAKSLVESIENRLKEDFNIDTNSVHRERSVTDTDKVKMSSMQDITSTLEQGVKDVFESGKYQSWLDTVSKFHVYSLNNQILIHLQNPEATYVRGYGDSKSARGGWFDFGRQVRKNETAIKILAPMFVIEKYKGELFKTVMKELESNESYHLPYTNLAIIRNNDKTYSICNNGLISNDKLSKNQLNYYLEKRVVGKMLCGFKPVNVFDISQCVIRKVKDKDGELVNDPRADNAVLSLAENIDNKSPEKMNLLFDVLVSVSDKNHVPIEIKDIQNSNGYYDLGSKRIAVSESLNESHKVKTAIHEIAHSRLHNELNKKDNNLAGESLRATWEVQAESIAYVVSKELGLDTSDYSFGYIAGWSSGKELSELNASMDIISKESKKLINDIDNELKGRNLDRSVLISKELDPTENIDFAKAYKKDPFIAFSLLKNNSKHIDTLNLSDNDLHFMANSKFLKERYSTFIKHTPDKFIDRSLHHLEQAKAIKGYGKSPFVEITFCEDVFDKPVFEAGQLLGIKEADTFYKKAEAKIQAERLKPSNKSFPDMKCYASIYIPIEHNNQKSLVVIHTKTSIGNGLQNGLIDALKNSDKLNNLEAGIKSHVYNMLSAEALDLTNNKDNGIEKKIQKVSDYKKLSSSEIAPDPYVTKSKTKDEVVR